jgi:hypothetical protein
MGEGPCIHNSGSRLWIKACTAPLNLWTDYFSFVTGLFVEDSVASEAPLPKRYLVALARFSVTNSTTVSHPNHLDRFHCVSGIFPDAFSQSTKIK